MSDTINKIGKAKINDPRSGKEYKKCHSGPLSASMSKKQIERTIRFNREIAYLGIVGHRREGFCKYLLNYKRNLIKIINTLQIDHASKQGQTISCHIGCTFCCNQLIQASLGECELIAFYLYQNEEILNAFTRAYPSWLEQSQKRSAIFNRYEEILSNIITDRMSYSSIQQVEKELHSYSDLMIPCPFLISDTCSIYEVRPLACASVVSVSQAEWCNPLLKKEAKTYCTKITSIIQIPFYDNNASILPPDRNMPYTVYRILTSGLRFFADIPGLESLYREFLQDNEIRSVIRKKTRQI